MSRYGLTLALSIALLLQLGLPRAHSAALEDFVRDPVLLDVKISPDGRHLAMLRRETGDRSLILTNWNALCTGTRSHPPAPSSQAG